MTVDTWVLEALRSAGGRGLTLREVQRYIDEHRYEELAVDTLQRSLNHLVEQGKVEPKGERYVAASQTSKEDALKKLFGDS